MPELVSRILVVLALALVFLGARWAYHGWRTRLGLDQDPVPDLPGTLLGRGPRTWVIFTTPYCATCGPVEERLRSVDPRGDVVRVDITEHPALAAEFRVRSAPTVFLASEKGRVQTRLVGATAVDRFVSSGALVGI